MSTPARLPLAAHDPAARSQLLTQLRTNTSSDIELCMALALGCSREDTEVLQAIEAGIAMDAVRRFLVDAFLESIGRPRLVL